MQQNFIFTLLDHFSCNNLPFCHFFPFLLYAITFSPSLYSLQGDSGGPMMERVGEKYILRGIVSWGVLCAQKGSAGIYSNVFGN